MTEIGWRAPEAAQRYVRTADLFIPGRRELLRLVASLVTRFTGDRPRVLDLGCGPGDVAATVLRVRPNASLCLVDFSEEMIRLSADRFHGHARVRLVCHDLNLDLPPAVTETSFDVVISCFALHHLEHGSRVPLYARVRRLLPEGGLFINGDRFREESARLAEWDFDNWARVIARRIRQGLGVSKTPHEVKQAQRDSDQRMGDKPGTIWEMRRHLEVAGFRTADCLWKRGHIALLAAAR